MHRFLCLGLVAAVVATTFAAIPATPAMAAAESVQETGMVTGIADGDTIWVNVDGDGTKSPVRVRLTGINATETSHGSNGVDTCHGRAAKNRMAGLVKGKRVQLRAISKHSHAGVRLRRTVYVRRNGVWTNVNRIIVAEGHALWLPNATEWTHNLDYARLAARAAARGRNLWDTDHCGSGPHQGSKVRVWVKWDADGSDFDNVNGEYIRIRNLNSSKTLRLGGWRVRDSDIDSYRIPAGTQVPAGKTLTIRVGRGRDTSSTLHWGLRKPVFDNASYDRRARGDGAYFFDRDGDLRWWFMYPCRGTCSDPLRGKVEISGVVYDAAGSDATNPNGEFVLIRLADGATSSVNLEGYMLRSWPYSYEIRRGTTLAPGEELTVHIGKGSSSRLRQHWGKSEAILNNGGDVAEIVTYSDVRIDCKSWGGARC